MFKFSAQLVGSGGTNNVSIYDYANSSSHYYRIFVNEGNSPRPDCWGKAEFVVKVVPHEPLFFLKDNLQRSFRMFPK